MTQFPFPWEHTPLKELPFSAVDVETTGFYPEKCKIVEVAVVPVNCLAKEPFQTLIDPETRIPPETSRIHGITDDMVSGKPKIAEVMDQLQNLLANSIFVSHNVPFDWGFFDKAFFDYFKTPLRMPHLCTLHLSRKYLRIESKALGSVCDHLGINLREAHRASADTIAVQKILEYFIGFLETRGAKTGGDLREAGLIKLHPPQHSRQR